MAVFTGAKTSSGCLFQALALQSAPTPTTEPQPDQMVASMSLTI